MTVSNLYITRADFLAWQRSTSVDTADDTVIDLMAEEVSRFIDSYTGRRFYPRIETRVFDIPVVNYTDRDTIYFDDDLLSLTTFTNGDLTVISPTDYVLKSANNPPYYAVKLRQGTNVSWQSDANGSGDQVLSVYGIWGYSEHYGESWVQAGTLGAAIASTSTTSATMTAGHGLVSGQLWKIDDEMIQGSVSTNTLTFNARGDNGSTAATHLINAPVYVWHPIPQIQAACQNIVNSLYKKRFGENVSSDSTITGAGVVLTPKDIPSGALAFLRSFVRVS